jgi:hypothetical protein
MNDAEGLFVGVEKAIGKGYAIPFASVEDGLCRRFKYETVNPEPKPFGKKDYFLMN